MKRGFNLAKQLKLFLILIIILSVFLVGFGMYLTPSFSPSDYDSKLDTFSKDTSELDVSGDKIDSATLENDGGLRGGEGFICDVGGLTNCFGDVDGNGVVNPGDRGFISDYDSPTTTTWDICRFDLDGNGFISPGDRGFVSANIGRCTPLPDYQDGSGCNHGVCPDPRFLSTHSICSYSQCISVQGPGDDECQGNAECDDEVCIDSDGFNPFSVGYVTMQHERTAPNYPDVCTLGGRVIEQVCRGDSLDRIFVDCPVFLGICNGDGECAIQSDINLEPSCSLISSETRDVAQQLLYNDEVIQLVEGGKIFDSQDTPWGYPILDLIPPYYYLIPSSQRILSIQLIINEGGWENDRVVLRDFVSSETFEVTITSGGTGVVSIDETVYPISYGISLLFGSSTYPSDYVTIDFPQTTGNDKMEFFSCGWQ